MGLISDLIQLVVDLIEREIRGTGYKAARVIAIAVVGFGLLFIGVALLTWGVFIVLLGSLGPIAASFIAGGAATVIAVVLLIYSRRLAG
jgi:hypothetical protein